jgi:hypothetical protein
LPAAGGLLFAFFRLPALIPDDTADEDFVSTLSLDAADEVVADLPGPELVTRIVRVSPARVQGSAMAGLFAARRRVHGPAGVPGLCGAVLHVSGWFVLWQEGAQAAVEAALQTSQRRQRYGMPRLIHCSVGPRTLAEPLALSSTQWAEKPERFAERIETIAAAAPQLQPHQVWRALSEPCTLAGATALLIPPRVGLLASDDPRSIEVARRLAELSNHPVVYRRFAGARPGSSDVGAAYLDLPLRAALLRVLAVSRRAFAYPLVHESLRHAGRITLLIGTQDARAMELAAGVAGFIGRTGGRPAIALVAESPEVGARVAAFLRECTGLSVATVPGRPTDAQLLALLMGPPDD